MKHIKNNTKKYLASFSTLVILTCLISYFSGCSDSVTNSTVPTPHYQAHSEQEFVADANLKAIPGAVIVVNLEHQNTPADSIPDTGTRGEDIIPYIYTETGLHHFRLGDSAKFKAKLVKDSGEILYELSPSNKNVSVTIPAGSYKLYLTSLIDYGSIWIPVRSQNLFIQQDKNYSNRNSSGNNVDYDLAQLNTFYTTGSCMECDLSNVNLIRISLNGGTFTESNFSNANLSQSIMTSANFDNANLTGADLESTFLQNCSFPGANLYQTNWNNSNHSFTEFAGTNMGKATFNNATFVNTDFTGANIVGASFCNAEGANNIIFQVIYNNTTKCWPIP